jgi:hypothetical protein
MLRHSHTATPLSAFAPLVFKPLIFPIGGLILSIGVNSALFFRILTPTSPIRAPIKRTG